MKPKKPERNAECGMRNAESLRARAREMEDDLIMRPERTVDFNARWTRAYMEFSPKKAMAILRRQLTFEKKARRILEKAEKQRRAGRNVIKWAKLFVRSEGGWNLIQLRRAVKRLEAMGL